MNHLSGGTSFIDPGLVLTTGGVASGSVVADLGCGALGHCTFPAADRVGKNGRVYAVDVRQIVLEGIKNRARIDGVEAIQTVWENLEVPKSTGIADGSVDVALMITTLFQNTKHQQMLSEAARILKSGGRLVVVDWLPTPTLIGPEITRRLTPQQVTAFGQAAGLVVAAEFTPSQYHFGLVFTKN